MNEVIELKKATIEHQKPNVIITRYKDGVEINMKDAQEIDHAHFDMAQGKDMCILVDLTFGDASISTEAEEYFVYKGKMIPYILGIGIVSKQKSSFFARLFGKNSKTIYPTKEFNTFEEANNWFASLSK